MNFTSCEKADDDKRISTVSPLGKKQSSKEKKDVVKSGDEQAEDKDAEDKDDKDDDGETAESRKVPGYKACKKPSKQMVEDHRRTHMKYEPWCPDCVMGRGLGARHTEAANKIEEFRTPTIAADYCFLGDDQEEKKLTILVARDSKTGGTCSTAVESKGGGCAWGVKRIANFVDGLGYGKIIFKSDNENSIVDVWNAVRIARTAQTIPENSPKGESQANGIAERAVQDVEGVLRTLKAALERRLGIRLKASDFIMPWMVEHCGTLINRCRVGVDGMTAYERIKGKPNTKKMLEFGESVLHMSVKSKKDKAKDKLNPRFEHGIWLGVHSRSNEDIIGTDQGVLRACTVKKLPDDERWNSERVLKLRGVPWCPREEPEVADEAREPQDHGDADDEEAEAPQIKRLYIKKEDILRYGYTGACPGCTALRNNKRAVTHNEACRKRVLEKMEANDDDKDRVAEERDRINEHLAKQIEQDAETEKKDGGTDHGGDPERKREKTRDEHEGAAQAKRRKTGAEEEGANSASSGGPRESGDEEIAHKKRRIEKESESADQFDDDGDCILKLAEDFDSRSCPTKAETTSRKRSDPHPRRPGLSDRTGCLTCGRRVNVKQGLPEGSDENRKVDTPKASLMDLTSKEEVKKAKDIGKEEWTKRVIKAVRQIRPNAIIGGGESASLEGWRKIYREQAMQGGYYVHNLMLESKSPILATLNEDRSQYYDLRAKKKMTIDSNVPEVSKAFDGRKIRNPCSRMRIEIWRQHAEDVKKNKEVIMTMNFEGKVWDDAKGGWLMEDKVKAAREEEMEIVKQRGVYERRPWTEAKERTGKAPIKLRWVDTNKGTESEPNYRSRIVAMEFKRDARLDLFAATPPLEAMKMVMSNAASTDDPSENKVLMTVDIKRAYFYAKSIRDTYIELPKEDFRPGDENKCGILKLSLYGTRDAAMNWEAEINGTMKELGYLKGKASTCVYRHCTMNSTAAIHGDDILTEGSEKDMREIFKKLSAKYECKMSMIGEGKHVGKKLKILNRTIEWTKEGITIEADKRHAEEIIKEACLKDNKKSTVPVSVEVVKDDKCSWRSRTEEMSPMDRKMRGRVMAEEIRERKEERSSKDEILGMELTRFRSVAARINYLAHDRADLKIAAMRVCKAMSSPKVEDWLAVEKVAKYLRSRPVVKCVYKWQARCPYISAYSDSDWAGDRVTRRSTSGGCLLRGMHLIKCWATTQHVIALSSGEAELYACVRVSSEAIGLRSVMEDMGISVKVDVFVDANAAIGMIMKEGLSGVRHIDTQFLWIQESVRAGRITLKKVDGVLNPADMFTKALAAHILDGHLHRVGYVMAEGAAMEGCRWK